MADIDGAPAFEVIPELKGFKDFHNELRRLNTAGQAKWLAVTSNRDLIRDAVRSALEQQWKMCQEIEAATAEDRIQWIREEVNHKRIIAFCERLPRGEDYHGVHREILNPLRSRFATQSYPFNQALHHKAYAPFKAGLPDEDPSAWTKADNPAKRLLDERLIPYTLWEVMLLKHWSQTFAAPPLEPFGRGRAVREVHESDRGNPAAGRANSNDYRRDVF